MLFPYICDIYILNATLNINLLGSKATSSEDLLDTVHRDCTLHSISLVLHTIFIYLTILIAAYLKFCMKSGRKETKRKIQLECDDATATTTPLSDSALERIKKLKNFRRKVSKPSTLTFMQDSYVQTFCNHKSVWIASTIIGVFVCLELAEAIVQCINFPRKESKVLANASSQGWDNQSSVETRQDYFIAKNLNNYDPSIFYHHVFAITSACATWLCLVSLIFLFREIECRRNQAKVLCVHVLFFCALFFISCGKFYVHVTFTHLTVQHVKVLADVVIGLGSLILSILYAHMILIHVSFYWSLNSICKYVSMLAVSIY